MSPVLQKALADLRRFPLQSLMLVIITAGAMAVFSLGILSIAQSGDPYTRLHESIKAPHLWAWFPGQANGYLNRIRELPGTEQHAAWKATFVPANVGTESLPEDAFLMAIPGGTKDAPGLRLEEGRHLTPGETGAVVLDRTFAREKKISLGDKVTLSSTEAQIPLEVVGLAVHTYACKYPLCKPSYFFTTEEVYAALGLPADHVQISMFATDPKQVSTLTREARKIANDYSECGCLLTEPRVSSYLDVRDVYQFLNSLRYILQVVFGVFAMVAVGLILANAISGMVLAEWRTIGILKALGFKRGQVVGVYFLQSLIIGLVGSALGVAAAHFLAPSQVKELFDSLGTELALTFNPTFAISAVAIGGLATALFAIPAALGAARSRPAEAIAHGFKVFGKKPSWLVKALWSLRLPMPFVLGVRDAVARPSRFITTVVTIMIAIFVMHFSFTFERYLDVTSNTPALENRYHQVTVASAKMQPGEIEAFLTGRTEVETFHSETRARVINPGIAYTAAALAYGPGAEKLPYYAQEGRWFQAKDEVVAGVSYLRAVGAKVGDTINITISEKSRDVLIVGQIFDMDFGGNLLVMSLETFREFDQVIQPTRYLVKLKDAGQATAVSTGWMESSGFSLAVKPLNSAPPAEITSMVTMLRQMSWVLALIAAVSLVSTMLMNSRERVLDTGILKSVGFSPGGTVATAMIGATLIGLVGIAIALPSARGVSKWMMDGGKDFGFGAFHTPELGAGVLALIGGIVILLAVAASLPAASWSARVSPARVLARE